MVVYLPSQLESFDLGQGPLSKFLSETSGKDAEAEAEEEARGNRFFTDTSRLNVVTREAQRSVGSLNDRT